MIRKIRKFFGSKRIELKFQDILFNERKRLRFGLERTYWTKLFMFTFNEKDYYIEAKTEGRKCFILYDSHPVENSNCHVLDAGHSQAYFIECLKSFFQKIELMN